LPQDASPGFYLQIIAGAPRNGHGSDFDWMLELPMAALHPV
jgi:hypothetical protein